MVKIMIVDDSAMFRTIMREMLESKGYGVVEADDGLTALEVYFLQKPDLVMLDLRMRDMNGIDVLNRLREMDRAARVIIVSADTQPVTRQTALDAGAAAFLVKPFTWDDILSTVQTVSEESENARTLP